MKTISIFSKNHGIQLVLVDDIDHPHLIGYKWWLSDTKGKYPYAWTRGIDPENKRRRVKMHRILLGLTKQNEYCDHIDKNTLNNQRSNLRKATPSQNAFNRKVRSHNPTGFKGVIFCPKNRFNKYHAYITFNGNKVSAGFFETAIEAAKAYNELAKKYHGEFAYQNPV